MWTRKDVWSFVNSKPVWIVLTALVFIAFLRYAPDGWKSWVVKAPPPTIGAEPAVVTKIERVVVPGPPRIQVIEKTKYIEKMPGVLTPATVANPDSKVVASAEVSPWATGTIATAVLEEGQDNVARTRIELKQLPTPFFQVKKEFGLRVGMGTGGLVVGEVYARPLRVGPVDIEVRGFIQRENGTGADFGGVALVDWRF